MASLPPAAPDGHPFTPRRFDRDEFDRRHAHIVDPVERKMILRGEVERFYERPPIPASLRREVYARDGYACLHCGATEHLSLDHIHPWSLGGPDTLENLQTLCKPCNSRKGTRV